MRQRDQVVGKYGFLPKPVYDPNLADELIDQSVDIFKKLKEKLGSLDLDNNLILSCAQQIRVESVQYPAPPAMIGAGYDLGLGDLLTRQMAQQQPSLSQVIRDRDPGDEQKAVPAPVIDALTMLIDHFGESAVAAGLNQLEPLMAVRRKQETKGADTAKTG